MTAEGHAAADRDEPLVLTTWLAAIERLKTDVDSLGEADHARLVRRAFHLSRLAPDPLWGIFASLQSEVDFENELESGGPEIAARNLINPTLELRISKPDGHFSAAVGSPTLKAMGRSVSRDYTTGGVGCLDKLHSRARAMDCGGRGVRDHRPA